MTWTPVNVVEAAAKNANPILQNMAALLSLRQTPELELVASMQEAFKVDIKRKSFHVFLSHSIADATLALGVWQAMMEQGIHAYLDWIMDHELDRDHVNENTAHKLRERMKASNMLVFVVSEHSSPSKWMPWECGFFDGYRGRERIRVIPVLEDEQVAFSKQEYLLLYDHISLKKSIIEAQDNLHAHILEKGLKDITRDLAAVHVLADPILKEKFAATAEYIFQPGRLQPGEWGGEFLEFWGMFFERMGAEATKKATGGNTLSPKRLTSANRVALEGSQAMWKQQAEILQETLKRNALANTRQLVEMVSKANQEASNTVNARISASLDEIKQFASQ